MYDLSKYDVFNSKILHNATYEGYDQFPILKGTTLTPSNLVRFSDCTNAKFKSKESTVMFYEHDKKFEKAWHSPERYIQTLKEYKCVISPDFSMYRNMPLVMQKWNHFRSLALAHYYEENEIEVIPNVRWSDARSFDFFLLGIPGNSTIAIGSHGCLKTREDKYYFEAGFNYALEHLEPSTIVIYGNLPTKLEQSMSFHGTKVIKYESFFSKSRRGGK